MWECQCECGKVCEIRAECLTRSYATRSCGCLTVDSIRVRRTTHGGTKDHKWTAEYGVWVGIINRCLCVTSSSYPRYGGRGVTVCEQWRDFANFRNDMGTRPLGMSIDRIDNARGYEPGNCRWASRKQQARNRRSNHLITINGVEAPVAQWAEARGLSVGVCYARLSAGWDPVRAVTAPVNSKKRHQKTP